MNIEGSGDCGGEDDVFVFSGFSFSASVCVRFSIFRFLFSFPIQSLFIVAMVV
jgi:hypothetical protein